MFLFNFFQLIIKWQGNSQQSTSGQMNTQTEDWEGGGRPWALGSWNSCGLGCRTDRCLSRPDPSLQGRTPMSPSLLPGPGLGSGTVGLISGVGGSGLLVLRSEGRGGGVHCGNSVL